MRRVYNATTDRVEWEPTAEDHLAVAVAALERIAASDPGPAYHIAKSALEEINAPDRQGDEAEADDERTYDHAEPDADLQAE